MSRSPLLLLLVLLAFPASADAAIFRIADTQATEALEGNSVPVTVVREGPTVDLVGVGLTLIDDAGRYAGRVAPFDGTPLKTNASFKKGESSVTVRVPIGDDDIVEGPQTLRIALEGGDVDAATRPVLVHDDDVQFGVAELNVDENAGVAHVPVQRLDPGAEITARYTTIDGTATSAADFTRPALPSQLRLPAGALTGTIDIPIARDQITEATEAFQVVFKTNGPPGSVVTVKILDDRTAPNGAIATAVRRLAPRLLFAPRADQDADVLLELRVDAATARRLKTKRVIAYATGKLAAGVPGRLALRLDRTTLRKLRRARRVKMTATAVLTDVAGNKRTVTRRITLTR